MDDVFCWIHLLAWRIERDYLLPFFVKAWVGLVRLISVDDLAALCLDDMLMKSGAISQFAAFLTRDNDCLIELAAY